MPADHLTTTDLLPAVTRVLAGEPLETTATAAGLDPAELADAVDAYHAAGVTALEHRSDSDWYEVRVSFPDWDTAETTAAYTIGPRLDQLTDAGATTGWWFLRKQPCWRLRFARPDQPAVHKALDELTARGALTRWRPAIYEPETTAFGGPAGLSAIHDLFRADSRGVLDYLRQPEPGLGRRELSLLLLSAVVDAAGLDWFERGGLFAGVARIRPAPDLGSSRLDALAGNVRGLLALPAEAHTDLFTDRGPVTFAAPWHSAHTLAGRQLREAAAAGRLQRGLRAVLTHIVIFHWNRLGLPAHTQAILARAATEAFLPRS